MEAKELRIGNYVYDDEYIIVKVESLTSERFKKWNDMDETLTFSKSTDDINLYSSRIQPIQLTEEILLKCGFEKDDSGVDISDQDYYEWYQKEFPVIGVLCQSSDKSYIFDENTDTIRIVSLHQLQNLYFAVTGTELEINL